MEKYVDIKINEVIFFTGLKTDITSSQIDIAKRI
jgi:hypothetical protein